MNMVGMSGIHCLTSIDKSAFESIVIPAKSENKNKTTGRAGDGSDMEKRLKAQIGWVRRVTTGRVLLP